MKRVNNDGLLYYHTKGKIEDAEDIDRILLDEDEDVYVDGSCFDGTLRTAHAGLAIVQLIGAFWQIIAYTLPEYLDQSAAFAEATALLISIRHMRQGGNYTVVSDCSAVIKGWAKIRGKIPLSPNAINAGIWRQIRDEANKKNLTITIRKVKAHRSANEVPEEEMKDWTGNEKADVHAKFAAKLGKWPDKVLEDEVLKFKTDKILMQQGLERACAAYEQGGDFIRKKARREHDEGDDESEDDVTAKGWTGEQGGHWLHYSHAERKVKCGACGLTFGSLKKAFQTKCKGGRTALLKACEAQRAKGHALYACTSSAEEVIVFCARCGHYASKQCIKLAQNCEGAKARTKHRKRTVNNILRGAHPEPNKAHIEVGPVWRLTAKAQETERQTREAPDDKIIELKPECEDNDFLANEILEYGDLEEAEVAARHAEDQGANEDEEEAMKWATETWGHDDEEWGNEAADVTPPVCSKPKRRRIRGKTTDFHQVFANRCHPGGPTPPNGGGGAAPV